MASKHKTKFERDIDNDSTDEYTLTYDAVGNLTDDGENYEYVYDAFGRLNQVKDESTGNVISQYRYCGNGHRASSVNDSDSDNDLGDETVTYLYHNERWQFTNTFHGSDADPYERYIHHAAGLYGGGGSSYIDRVVLIDRDTNLNGTFNVRLYPMQNFRADVIGMITDTGKQRGQTRYDPYGVPFGIFAGDINGDGIWDGGDLSILASELTASNYHVRYDEDLNGTFDAADIGVFINLGHVGGRGVPSDLNSPFSYAGYEDDPDLAGSKMHVRNRVYLSDTGRWTSRDPLGKIEGLEFRNYSPMSLAGHFDPLGLLYSSEPRPGHPTKDGGHGDCCPLPLNKICRYPGSYCTLCIVPSPASYAKASKLQHCRCGIERDPTLPPYNPNGCGGKPWQRSLLNLGDLNIYNMLFATCCNGHDRGYAKCGSFKPIVDVIFLTCMIKRCSDAFPGGGGLHTSCLAAAAAYYSAVSGAPADEYFCPAQDDNCVCSGTCIL